MGFVDNENWYCIFRKEDEFMMSYISNLVADRTQYLSQHLEMLALLISILAFILSLISFIYNRKDKKIEHDYSRAMKEFEEQKENIRRLERNDDKFENRLNLISILKPYLDIKLYSEDFDTCYTEDNAFLKIGIGLINIGKDTAVNIELSPYSDLNIFNFKKSDDEENKTVLDGYLSENSVKVDDVIKLWIMKEILDVDRENQCIKFKIKYYDLIGNLYEQEFEFTYSNHPFGGFEKEKKSYPPRIIEYAKNDLS